LKWHPRLALAALAGTCPEKRPPRPLHPRFFLPVPLIDPRRRRCLRFPATSSNFVLSLRSSRRPRGASTGLRVLSKLQLAFEHHQLGLMNVWPNTIVWLDQKEHTNLSRWREGDFDYSRTLRRWVETDASHNRQFSLAVMTTLHIWCNSSRARKGRPGPNGRSVLSTCGFCSPIMHLRGTLGYDLNAPGTQAEAVACQATMSMPPEPKKRIAACQATTSMPPGPKQTNSMPPEPKRK
ncbi:hypothetical protein B0H14DRAFT_3712991, partial [Mycena olivaceomarginata]